MRLNALRIVREGSDVELILLAIEDRTDLERMAEQVRQHVAELVEGDQSKTAFLSLLAHELRNPLAAMSNAQHVLDQAGISEDVARRMHAMIERQVQQLTRLVDDLLDLARINRGRIEMRKGRIELRAVVEAAVDAARPLCGAKGVELIAELPDEPVPLEADAARLTQVVSNLLNNACKFTDPGGRIELTLERADGEAVVRVADNGVGIAADQLPRVFDMYMQADSSAERSATGLGLGLTLVKQLVEAHGGTVSAKSEGLGRGSEFAVRLPLPQDTAPVDAHPDTPAPAPGPESQRRVLIVDDNHDGAEALAMAIGQQGHEVRTVHDGESALALAASWRPEVVVLDIGMPGMSGYEVARRLGQQPWRRAMRLVALSGWTQGADPLRAAEAGFDAHLVKPADVPALIKLVSAPLPKAAT